MLRLPMKPDLHQYTVGLHDTIRDAMACIERSGKGIALVINPDGSLHATITDGDVRRVMLAKMTLDTLVCELLKRKIDPRYMEPVTAPEHADNETLLRVMKEKGVRHMPLVDGRGRVKGLATIDELLPEEALPLKAVIMAGGRGTRLRPHTEEVPKPMLLVDGRPLMEHIVDQLRGAGIKRVSVATQYLAEKIADHFEDGSRFGVELDYVKEDEPRGTAGALGLMAPWTEPLLVINGDVLTQINLRAMLEFHRENSADMTVAVSKYEMGVPYGVVECEGAMVRKLAEKPVYSFLVNAGVYFLEPLVRRYVPTDRRFDMTDLIAALLSDGRSVVSFPILEYWLDVGRPVDYEQAKEDVRNGRLNRKEH